MAIVLMLIAAEGNEIDKMQSLFKFESYFHHTTSSVSAYDYDDAFEDALDDFHEFGKS